MKNHKIRQAAILVALVWALMIPATNVGAEDAPPTKAAEVNGHVISYIDFEREFENYKLRFQGNNQNLPPLFVKQLRSQVINELINQELLFQESKKKGVTVSMASVEKEVATIQQRFPDKKEFQKALAKMQISEKEFKAQYAEKSAIRALIEKEIVSKINVNEDEAKAYFDTKPGKFDQKERVRARHILIKLEKGADDEQKEQARKTLQEIKKKLLAGEDFAFLAKQHSQGPSSTRGGDLGYFSRGQMVKPFEDVAFSLAKNEISDIVETQFGYHLIKVEDHQTEVKSTFEQVKPKVISMMRNERIQQQVQAYIGKLRQSAKIENFIE